MTTLRRDWPPINPRSLYALARRMGVPLLFVRDDFQPTDALVA